MENDVQNGVYNQHALFHVEFFLREMIELLDIRKNITYFLSNVKLILVTNNYFLEIKK